MSEDATLEMYKLIIGEWENWTIGWLEDWMIRQLDGWPPGRKDD